ncbi:ACT domain-containing protein [Olegusella massiliensis]|uniref:ACT domain-containing protein n=1 Tax=Olegusella massiliensis TaxID=1776381 RepID=UPI0003ADEB1D|nr:ACT domain-containing protein [Olegusella massiliensis]ERL12709.1 ACT domain protein [Coriobacteriaceae bacterium BV3Ac1]
MASQMGEQTNRAVVSVLGSDRPGIVAAVSTVLAQADANILDISQTILQGIFTMTMLVDLSAGESDFADLQSRLAELQEQLGVQIMLQREDVFRYMYRL